MQPVASRPHHPGQHHIEDIEGLRVGGEVEPRFADRPPGVALSKNLQLRAIALDHDTADVRCEAFSFLTIRRFPASSFR